MSKRARTSASTSTSAATATLDYTDRESNPTRFDQITRLFFWLAFAGVVARFVVCGLSWGSSDSINFARFAYRMRDLGLFPTYRLDPLFNHPLLPAYWTRLALYLAREEAFAFTIIFRIPVILADSASAWLLWRIARVHGASPRAAMAVAAGYAWNLCGILVSGYHCNTDPIFAMLCLLSAYLLQDRKRPLLAGLTLGLAINIKLVPVLLIPALCALLLRRRRELMWFIGGLAVMAIPYLPPILFEPAFTRNVLAYRSQLNNWGIPVLLGGINPHGPEESRPSTVYFRIGTPLLLAAVVAWAALVAWLRRWDAYRAAAVPMALFLVLAPGFGMQYLVVVAPLLYVGASPRIGNVYGLAAGLFCVGAYWFYWDGGLPFSSLVHQRYPQPLALFGLVAWGVLVYFLAVVAPRRTSVTF